MLIDFGYTATCNYIWLYSTIIVYGVVVAHLPCYIVVVIKYLSKRALVLRLWLLGYMCAEFVQPIWRTKGLVNVSVPNAQCSSLQLQQAPSKATSLKSRGIVV